MAETLHVTPAEMIRWALAHERAADACASARAEHPRTIEAAQSWGPLFHEARRATVEAVNARERALLAQEERHRAMAQELRTGAARMEQMNAENQANLTISE